MALETFDFPYHSFKTENPESGFRGQLGQGYTFTAPPTDPDQRRITLSYALMKFYTDEAGELDAEINPQLNMLALINFYQRHKLYKSFHYVHPIYGELEVKFSKPLVEEEVLPGGFGIVKAFTIELIEIP